ncbi:MAG: LCP family protein [Clostridia bacterium]|nr:LCP family protein [Clostridia bacterium]
MICIKEEKNIEYVKRILSQKINIKRYLLVLGTVLCIALGAFFAAASFGIFGSKNVDSSEEIQEDLLAPVDKQTGKLNVLLLGVDMAGLRTDTIIVASYDLDGNKLKLLSIPRDTRMYVGARYQKINAAHAITQSGKIKGPQGTIEAVTRLTGIPINYYVEFSFSAFRNTIDALGGVDFDVPRDMFYEDPVQDLHINLKKGFQHLDGDKAEQLVRFRRYPEGDIARVKMQQSFLKALMQQKLNAQIITKIPDIISQLKDDVNTNFTVLDAAKYLPNLKDLSVENVQMYHLPGEYNDTDYGASYWICDLEATKTLVESEFGYDATKITIHSADGKSKSKDVKLTPTASVPPSSAPEETEMPPVQTKQPIIDLNETEEKPSSESPAEETAGSEAVPLEKEAPMSEMTEKTESTHIDETLPANDAASTIEE